MLSRVAYYLLALQTKYLCIPVIIGNVGIFNRGIFGSGLPQTGDSADPETSNNFYFLEQPWTSGE